MKKIKCDFCSKEINCPEEELNAEKHACYNCFLKQEEILSDEELDKIQVDIPDEQLNNIAVQQIVEEVFPTLWDEQKDELKDMSKKEMAQFMFAAGASAMAERMLEMEDEEDDNINEEEDVGGE